MLWGQAETSGVIQNWVSPASTIPGNTYMLTWGVDGSPEKEPDVWHFHVVLVANSTADVLLLWNLNESILYQKSGSKIDETFDVPLPRTNNAWRWDWMIKNPQSSMLGVANFTITHYAIMYPERQNGLIAIGLGLAIIAVAGVSYTYLSRRGTQLSQLNRNQPPLTNNPS